jgi:hypothetical protein
MLYITPYAVQWTDEAILLLVRTDEKLLQIANEAVAKTSQPLSQPIHMVLASGSFEQRKRMFYMPKTIPVSENVLRADNKNKTTFVLEVAEEGTTKLDAIVCALIGESFIDPSRKYHLVLSSVESPMKIEDESLEKPLCEDATLGGLFAA